MTTTGSGLPATAGTLRRRREGPPSFRARLRRSFHQWWFAYAMLVPVFLVMGLLVFYPLGRGIYLSFTNADQFNLGGKDLPSSYTWVGLDNYRTIFESAEFKSVAWFTVVWTFTNVFFHFTVGLILALVLNRTSVTLDRAATSLEAVMTRMNSGEGTLGRLSRDDSLYVSLNRAAAEIANLAADIRANPRKYVNLEIF